MPTTITSFVTFIPGTKAKATEVNTNFSNFRGDFLPINTDTASASNRSHDLGSTDHYWTQCYVQAHTIGITTTAGTITGNTVGSLLLSSGETTGSTQVEVRHDGLVRQNLVPVNMTFSAASGCGNFSNSGTSFATIPTFAVTFTSKGGLVEIKGVPTAPVDMSAATGLGAGWGLQVNSTVSVAAVYAACFRDGTTVGMIEIRSSGKDSTTSNTVSHFVNPFSFIDFYPTTASSVYEIRIRALSSQQTAVARFMRMMVKELE